MIQVDQIVSILRKLVQEGDEFVPLHAPHFAGNEAAYVEECVRTGWVSSVGKFVDDFELKLAEYCDVERAVACVNGTAALHACLQLAGVERDTEVLMPSLTFVATANAASYCGAVPHFVEVEEATLGLDPDALDCHLNSIAEGKGADCRNRETGRRIAAIVPMHAFGFPVRLDELVEVAARWKLPLVEDAAESLGSYYKDRHTGGHGLVSAVSFNGNKIITSGGGGAILTNDSKLADLAKHLTTTGKVPHRWEFKHDMVAYNYRMPNLNAALALGQLEQLEGKLERKRRLSARYTEALAAIPGLRLMTEPEHTRANHWLNTVLLDDDSGADLEALLAATNAAGVMTRPAWTPLHQLTPFEDCPRSKLDLTERLARRLINIPSSAELEPCL